MPRRACSSPSAGRIGAVVLSNLSLLLTGLLCASAVMAQPPGVIQPSRRQHDKLAAAALRQTGNAARGRRLFSDEVRTKCQVCHKVAGKGGAAGPDLTSIGGKFDRPHLIESLLEPSKQIVEGYRSSIITTRDGRVLTGIVKPTGNGTTHYLDASGKQHQLVTTEISSIASSPLSLMPAGLADQLNVDEFVDLVAYLETLRPGGKPRMGAGVVGPIRIEDGFEVRSVATGLNGATALEVLPDGRLLVCEQTGAVRVVKDGHLLSKPFVTLPVEAYWERGVIGVTCDPDFPRSPYVYVCWVAKTPYPHHRISRFTAQGDVAVEGSEKVLLVGDDQTKLGGKVPAGHQGGALHFGPDGKLYIAIGEQTAGKPSQDLDSLLGKLLRINPDGSIPANNPFVSDTEGKYQAIWARGLRNPFTFAFQASSGLMLINDVGGKFEEINVGQAGGNYGWPIVDHGPRKPNDRFLGPIHWYPQSSLNGADFCSADSHWPRRYRGRFFFADFVHGWIRSIDPANGEQATEFASGIRRPVDLRFAPDGSLYLLLRNAWVMDGKFQGGTGSLLRIDYTGQRRATAEAASRPGLRSEGTIRLTDNVQDASAGDLPAIRIQTPAATYYLEKSGGGLSSLVDHEGNDWLGFHPRSGSGAGGEYRGFPNAVFREAGNYFHPKNANTDPVDTSIRSQSDRHVVVQVASKSGHWAGRYDFYPTHCTFTMTAVPADHQYWALYEGTPGGSLELDDWWMTSEQPNRRSVATRHEGDIASPEWIAFGDKQGARSIVLVHHQDDEHPDTFYQMKEKMTVFGFGRQGLKKFIDKQGEQFSIALLESTDYTQIDSFVRQQVLKTRNAK